MSPTSYVFVKLTDRSTQTPVAVRVDQIVAIVPLKNPPVTLLALLDNENVMVSETTTEVLDAMAQVFKSMEAS